MFCRTFAIHRSSLAPSRFRRGLKYAHSRWLSAQASLPLRLIRSFYTTQSPTLLLRNFALAADALAFDGAGERLLAVEKAARRVHLVSGFGESPAITEVLSERDGLSLRRPWHSGLVTPYLWQTRMPA